MLYPALKLKLVGTGAGSGIEVREENERLNERRDRRRFGVGGGECDGDEVGEGLKDDEAEREV